MKKLKVLIPIWLKPDSTSQIIILYKNLFEEFRKNVQLEIIWFVYMPKINKNLINKNFEKVIQFQEYSDADMVLEETKPDIVFAIPSYNLIDYAFSLASKNKDIPVISGTGQVFSKNFLINSILKTMLSSCNPTDQIESTKLFAKLRFLIKKSLFLIRTQRKTNQNIFHILKNFFDMFHNYNSKITLLYDPKYSTDLCWVSGKENYNELIQSGYKEEQIILSGNPIYDEIFKRKIKSKKVYSEKIRVLFAPHPLYEHGHWSKEKQEEVIIKIMNELTNNQSKFEIIVKIHPSSAIKTIYRNAIDKINPKIQIFQDGSIEDFFDRIDVIVSYHYSSVNIFGFLSDIPSVVCNLFGEKNEYLSKYEIAKECPIISNLNDEITTTVKKGVKKEKYEEFIRDSFFKDDGLASKRVVDAVMELLKKRNF
jgi:hypothetical protein